MGFIWLSFEPLHCVVNGNFYTMNKFFREEELESFLDVFSNPYHSESSLLYIRGPVRENSFTRGSLSPACTLKQSRTP